MRTVAARVLDATHLELTEPIPSRPGQYIEISIPKGRKEPRPNSVKEKRRDAASTEDPAPALSAPHRERELAWCRHHEEELDAYLGQWVVLEGEEIMAHGQNAAIVVEQARERGIEIPYIFYVEEFKPDVVKMGL
ncbi:MAG: hypothetical protein GY856_21220 [bacterium]|nr:hypothetical protein [bacterium]